MSGRRGNGEGTVSFDKSKQLYYGVISAGGARRKTRGYKSADEAQLALLDLRHDVAHGVQLPDRRHTLSDLVTRWLVDIVEPHNEYGTWQNYESNWRVHIQPRFGRLYLEDLRRLDIQQWANQLRKQGKAVGTVRGIVTTLVVSLNQGVDWGWLQHNPALRIKIADRDRTDERQINGLTTAESEKLLAAAQGRNLESLFVVAVWTGMRKAELLGLRWADIEFDRARVHITQTLEWRSGRPWQLKSRAKTRAGLRAFPLLPVVGEALLAQRARVAQLRDNAAELWTEHDLVFPSEIGTPTHPSNVNREQAKLEAAGGVKHRVHDWRHTAATRMRAAGVDDRTIMQVCGWTDRSMLDRYQHVHDEHLDDMLERMLAHYPEAAGTGIVSLPTRSKYAGRPHTRSKGARLALAPGNS